MSATRKVYLIFLLIFCAGGCPTASMDDYKKYLR